MIVANYKKKVFNKYLFLLELEFIFSQVKYKMVNKSINQFIFLINYIGLKFQFDVTRTHNAFRIQHLDTVWRQLTNFKR